MNTRNPGLLNILIIDDDEDDFFITSSILKNIREYELNIEWIPTYKEAMQRLYVSQYNIVFVDYRLGAKTGAELIEDAVNNGIHIPIILLTGKGNALVDKAVMEKGAYDYLVKAEITPESLERSIRYALARYQSRIALQKSEKKYRAIFENSKDAIFILNENFELIDINDTARKLFNNIPQASDASIYKLFKRTRKAKEIIARLEKADEVLDEEVELKITDGVEYIGLLTLTREKDEEGNVYFQGVFHDITELKKAEQANVMAEKFEATQRFVRMLAHEVRNPLNNILLSLGSLKISGDEESKSLYSEIIERNSLRINSLVTELLNSFKISEGELVNISLNELVKDALTSVEDRLMLKGVQLKEQGSTTLTINADAEKLKLALANFFLNSIEAMKQDKGILDISYSNDNGSINLIIRDNGCGMNEAQLQRLFEPYFTTKKNGIGLGLSSAMAILRSHKATVDVHSQVNNGTEFTISFPRE